jgi:hypothetical protein
MAKNKVSEWDSVASNNIVINGININENCPPSAVNNAIREMMAQIRDWQSGTSGDDVTINGTLTSNGATEINGSFSLDGNKGTTGQVLVSKGSSATPTWGDAFVTGMIMLWSGSTGSVPSGWRLCDGGGGTPDLRNRFVVGAGSSYGVGAKGGATTATTSAKSLTTSTKSVVVGRDGWGTVGGPLGTAHNGRILVGSGQNEYSEGLESIRASGRNLTTGSHNHTVGAHNHTVDTRSPYYALAYIMKI